MCSYINTTLSRAERLQVLHYRRLRGVTRLQIERAEWEHRQQPASKCQLGRAAKGEDGGCQRETQAEEPGQRGAPEKIGDEYSRREGKSGQEERLLPTAIRWRSGALDLLRR